MKRALKFLLALSLGWGSLTTHAQEKIGQVVSPSGVATITRQDLTFRAVPNAPLVRRDMLATGPASQLSFQLLDGSSHTLGQNTKIVLDRLSFDPKNQSQNELQLTLLEGAIASRELGSRLNLRVPNGSVLAAPGAEVLVQIVQSASGISTFISNISGSIQIVTEEGTFDVAIGAVVAINEDGSVSFNASPPDSDKAGADLQAEGSLDQPIEPDQSDTFPTPAPSGSPSDGQPPPTPTPAVTPTPQPSSPPTPAPTFPPSGTSPPTPSPSAGPTPSPPPGPTPPTPSPGPTPPPPPPTPTPVSPF